MSERTALYRTIIGSLVISKVTERAPDDDDPSRPARFVAAPIPDVEIIVMVNRDDDGFERMLMNLHRRGHKRAYAQITLPPEIAHAFQDALFGAGQ